MQEKNKIVGNSTILLSNNPMEEPVEKPHKSKCERCKDTLLPFKIQNLDGEVRWIPPAKICLPCEESIKRQGVVKEQQDRIQFAFKQSMLSPRFQDRVFENFKSYGWNDKALEVARDFEINSYGHGLLFSGPCGVGKTHLAAAITNKYIGKEPVLYVSVPEFLRELRENIRIKGSSNKTNMARSVALLILDDIGAEKPTDWALDTLYVIVNYRYENKLPTIYTTNFSMEDLEKRVGARITSRISEVSRIIQIEGPDLRLVRGPKQGRGAR